MAAISQEEENFVRQSMLLTGIAPRAVRVLFDKEFPPPLRQFVTKNLMKLKDLNNKRVINNAQWTIIYGANPVSIDFDITLMICLIRNFSSISVSPTGFDNLPHTGDKSECADLARIKFYRNKMAHMDDNKISQNDFQNQWKELSQAIGRLGGSNFVSECQNLLTAKLDQSNHEVITEVKMAREENQSLQKEIDQIRNEKQDNIPKNMLAVMKTIRDNNKDKLKKFVVTRSAKSVLETLQKEQCVVITGESGSGKSATAYYAAFYLQDHEGFQILPVSNPLDIIHFTISDTNQLFLFDDVVGKDMLYGNYVTEWERVEIILEEHLKTEKNIKVLMTCRSNIYERNTNKTLGLSLACCDLSSDTMRLSLSERKQIALSYLTEDCVNQLSDDVIQMYPFFPLLCQMRENTKGDLQFFEVPDKYMETEISYLRKNCDPAYICFALVVIFNNCVDTKLFTIGNREYTELFEDMFYELEFKKHPTKAMLLSSMRQLTKTYLKESNNGFCTIRNRLFDIICYVVGNNIKQCLIKHGSSSFIKERVKFESIDDSKNQNTILLHTSLEEAYFNRLQNDMKKGENWTVFGNCQTNSLEYKKKFIEFINTKAKSDIIFCPRKEDKQTGLNISALLGYTDFCVMILTFDEMQVNLTNANLWMPIHCSSDRGQTCVTKLLLTYRANLNEQEEDGWTPLNLACHNGHKGVVELLLDHHAYVNTANNKGWTPLHQACNKGYTDIAELLLTHNADVNKQEENGRTPLQLACENDHKDVIELLRTYIVYE